MRRSATIALFATLLTALPGALAAPMYKCVSPAGKISYSTDECAGTQRQAKQFQVADPSRETEQERAARLSSESEKLRQANDAFSQRQRERDQTYANEQSAAAANAQARRSAAQAAAARQAEIDRAANERGRMARQFYCNSSPGRC